MSTESSALTGVYIRHHLDTARHSGLMHHQERSEFLHRAVGTGKRVLDIGCRNGALTASFLEGNAVFGYDIDVEALKLANGRGVQTSLVDLNGAWPDNGLFDVVVMTEVLEHLYNPEIVIEKVSACLAPGGKYVGSVPNGFSLKNRIRLLFGKKKYTSLGDPTHINHFTRQELCTLLSRHFKNIRITPLGNGAWLERYWPGMGAFILQWEADMP